MTHPLTTATAIYAIYLLLLFGGSTLLWLFSAIGQDREARRLERDPIRAPISSIPFAPPSEHRRFLLMLNFMLAYLLAGNLGLMLLSKVPGFAHVRHLQPELVGLTFVLVVIPVHLLGLLLYEVCSEAPPAAARAGIAPSRPDWIGIVRQAFVRRLPMRRSLSSSFPFLMLGLAYASGRTPLFFVAIMIGFFAVVTGRKYLAWVWRTSDERGGEAPSFLSRPSNVLAGCEDDIAATPLVADLARLAALFEENPAPWRLSALPRADEPDAPARQPRLETFDSDAPVLSAELIRQAPPLSVLVFYAFLFVSVCDETRAESSERRGLLRSWESWLTVALLGFVALIGAWYLLLGLSILVFGLWCAFVAWSAVVRVGVELPPPCPVSPSQFQRVVAVVRQVAPSLGDQSQSELSVAVAWIALLGVIEPDVPLQRQFLRVVDVARPWGSHSQGWRRIVLEQAAKLLAEASGVTAPPAHGDITAPPPLGQAAHQTA